MSPLNHLPPVPHRRVGAILLGAVAAAALGVAAHGCTEDGDDFLVAASTSVAPTTTALERWQDLPGLALEIVAVSSGSGPSGNLQVGDTLSVTFTVEEDDGDPIPLAQLDSAGLLLSGPTFNYQRVLPRVTDVITRAVANQDGSYTYTFATPIPATYAAPYNDTSAFGTGDGELTGQALLSGTYTVGLEGRISYTVGQAVHGDGGSAALDVLLGDAAALEPRQVVSDATCNQCHGEVRAHSTRRIGVRGCVLCHTSGAEDNNAASLAGGTPGASIDFRVMIHRIHNGAHLPSVLGVSTDSSGGRVYTTTPASYDLAGGSSVHEFSDFSFPVMPSAYVAFLYDQAGTTYTWAAGNGPMPKDVGYAGLAPENRQKEDQIRTGNISCAKCHGDPDGSGPVAAPAQGALIFAQPTRRACGSCHDDVNWGLPYAANGVTMPAQPDDSQCVTCHAPTGAVVTQGGRSVEAAHLHPWSDPVTNTGVNLSISAVTSNGVAGNLQVGDTILATFSVKDDAGADIPLHSLTRFQLLAVGPTTNPQIVIGNHNVVDFAFRTSTPFTGKGTISKPTVATGATQQTLAIVFTGPTAFDVIGSSSGTLASGLPLLDGGDTGDLTYAGVTFKITDGSPDFAAGDRYYLEVIPVQSSYTLPLPWDIARERVGVVPGAFPVSLPVANGPHQWGQQKVWERTAVLAGSTLTAAGALFQGYVEVDMATLPGVAVKDIVCFGDGTPDEEYLEVGRIQTTDDRTGADLGTRDRLWFNDKQFLHYAHPAGTAINEVTLSARREGSSYTWTSSGIDVLGAGWTLAGNPIVVSYRATARFGFRPAPGKPRLDMYLPPPADEDELDLSWGEWKGLPLLAGTYTVGGWANKDFTVDPLGAVVATEAWNKSPVTDNTTYRMISPPATKRFLLGSGTVVGEQRAIIEDYEACNKCHGELQAHGFGRRGLETCLLCHASPGVEDGTKRGNFSAWSWIGATPGADMEFRNLLHKVHMAGALDDPPAYVVNGVFLGIPYPVTYEGMFPAAGGEAARCEVCHGENNTAAWIEPAPRDHPTQQLTTPTRIWRTVCGACHDSAAAHAHIDAQTGLGVESCVVCHGPGGAEAVEDVHRRR